MKMRKKSEGERRGDLPGEEEMRWSSAIQEVGVRRIWRCPASTMVYNLCMKWMLTIFTLIHLRIITTSQQFVTRGLEILNPSRSTITITNTMTVIMTIFIFLLLIMTDQFVTRGLAILGPSSSLPSSLSSPPSSSSSLSLKYLAAFLPETNLRDF